MLPVREVRIMKSRFLSEFDRHGFARRLYETCKTPRFGSISALARVTGVSRYTVQKWLSTESVPTGTALFLLARAGVDVNWLLLGGDVLSLPRHQQ